MQLQEVNCPVCSTSTPKRLKYPATFDASHVTPEHFAARNDFRKTHFRIMECTGCKMWISDPALRGPELHHLYEGAEHNYQELEHYIRIPYSKILQNISSKIKSKKRFVEIGGGNGFLFDLPELKKFEERIEIEPSGQSKKDFLNRNTNGRFIQGTLSTSGLPAESVSLLAFFHVLDHLDEPLAFLKEVFEVLEPGGGVACVVHNTQALSSLLLGKRSPILGVWHTFLYNPSNLKRLFELAGFSQIKVSPIRNTYPLWYWTDHLPMSQNIRKQNKNLLAKLSFDRIPISAYAGNLGVTALK